MPSMKKVCRGIVQYSLLSNLILYLSVPIFLFLAVYFPIIGAAMVNISDGSGVNQNMLSASEMEKMILLL